MLTYEPQTTEQTLQQYGLDWTVERKPLFIGYMGPQWNDEGSEVQAMPGNEHLPTHYANVHSKTDEVLGVVGHGYQILQNEELYAIAEAIESETGNKIESGGSFRGGKDVYIQLKGNQFSLPGDDVVEGYRLYYNNHAGEKNNQWVNTTLRVWCQNTLNAALKSGRKNEASIMIRHTGNMKDRIEEAIISLKQSDKLAEEFRAVCETLAKKTIVNLESYFTQVYEANYGPTPSDDPEQKAKHTRMLNLKEEWNNNFQGDEHPSSMWTALNAVTEWSDHNRTVRGEAKDSSLRKYSNLFGTSAEFKRKALNIALEMV